MSHDKKGREKKRKKKHKWDFIWKNSSASRATPIFEHQVIQS